MDFAHLVYAIMLLALAVAFAFHGKNARYWWLPCLHSSLLMLLELQRAISYSHPFLADLRTEQSAIVLGASLALWEFGRVQLQDTLPKWFGRWTMLLPPLVPLAAVVLWGEDMLEPSAWFGVLLPSTLLAAWGVYKIQRSMRFAALVGTCYAFAVPVAGVGGMNLNASLFVWGWVPAIPLGILAATASCAVLWQNYVEKMPLSLKTARRPVFNAKMLGAFITLTMSLAALLAWKTGGNAKNDVDADFREDVFFMASALTLETERNAGEAADIKEAKAHLDRILASLSIDAASSRILAFEPISGKIQVLVSSETRQKAAKLSAEAEAELSGMMNDSIKDSGMPKMSAPYMDAGRRWLSSIAPLKWSTEEKSPVFLEMRLPEENYAAQFNIIRFLPLTAGFLLSALGIAFFAVGWLNFESKAVIANSEAEKELALWGADAGTWRVDLKSWEITCSPRCMEMLGYPVDISRWPLIKWRELIHPDDNKEVFKRFYAHQEGKTQFFESEHRMQRSDGTWSWILARGRISARGAAGEPLEAAGVHLDINTLKESEQQLLQSKLRLESAQRTAGLGVWELDVSNGEMQWNEQCASIFGIPFDTPPSWEVLLSRLHPDDLQVMNFAREKCESSKYPVETNCRIIMPDGSLRHVQCDGQPLCSASGKVIRIEGAALDITDFILAEEALARSEKDFRTLVENLDDVVVRIGRDLRISYISPSVTKYAKISPHLAIGKTAEEAGFDKANSEFWNACTKSVIENGKPLEREFAYDTEKGKRLFNWRIFPEFADDGSVASVLSITRDVTKRREAEMAFRDIFSNMLEGFAMNEMIEGQATPDFKFLSINPAFERLTGIGASELLNRKASEALPGIGGKWLEIFAELVETGIPTHFEGAIDGIDKRFEISAYRAAPGKFAFILADVTEKARAVDELHRQMHLMKAILDGIPDILILMRPDRSIVACNRTARACMGWEGEDLRSFKCHSLLGLSKECDPCACVKAAEICAPSLRNFDSTETGRNYEIRSIPIPSPDTGRTELVVELIRDITEKSAMERDLDRIIDSLQSEILQRMNAEEALRRSEKLHRMITEAAQVGIWQLQPDGKIKYLNPRMREMLEIEPDEDIQLRNCFDFIPENQIKPLESAKNRNESFIHSYESEIIGHKGAKRIVLVSGIVLYLPGTKKLDAYIETFTDITLLRKAEKEDELRKLKLMQTEKMASLGILVSGVAHEINNPTNFIMLNAPLLLDIWKGALPILDANVDPDFNIAGVPYKELRPLVPELFKSVSDGAERIKNIVAGLKDYARQEITDPYATVQVNDAVQAAMVLLGNMIKKSTRRFKTSYGKNLPEVKGAKQKLEQVVINLVQNACQSLKNMDCALEIKTTFENGLVKIIVSDEGCGIPKENMAFIMDPFFTTKRDTGGTGLGLSISAGIVNELGGELLFDSEQGVGTTATISLPPALKS